MEGVVRFDLVAVGMETVAWCWAAGVSLRDAIDKVCWNMYGIQWRLVRFHTRL